VSSIVILNCIFCFNYFRWSRRTLS